MGYGSRNTTSTLSWKGKVEPSNRTGLEKQEGKIMRGSALDILFFPVLILLIFLFLLFPTYIYDKVSSQLHNQLPEHADVISGADTANSVLKQGFIWLVFGFFIASLISAYLVPNHPIFIFFAFFFYALGIFIATVVKSVVEKTFAANSEFISQIPLASWLFDHLVSVVVVFGFLMIVLMYSGVKRREVNL